jgi:hypothetical protein
VATQLTSASARAASASRIASRLLTPRVLAGAVVVCLVLAFASVIAAAHNARSDEAAARTRYNDAQALVALPPASNDAAKDDLASVQAQLATAQAGVGAPTIDPAADDLTSLLVRSAADAGLAVKGVQRAEPSQATLAGTLYQVQAIHITVSGSVGQVTVFLRGLSAQQPALIASLASMTANDAGVAQADLMFSAYEPAASPTPAPVPTARTR